MRLSSLLQFDIEASNDIDISGLCLDSRTVQHDDVFVAYPGNHFDGRDYIDAALERGAVAVLYESSDGFIFNNNASPCIAVANLTQRLSELAQRFYAQPQKALILIGITGTNGKTSVSHYVSQLLYALGQTSGIIGTVGWGKWGTCLQECAYTTPDIITLYRQLHLLVQQGITHVVMEVSSHGLDQGRVDGLQFAVGVVTNITQDHLDYHHTMAAYIASKRQLLHFSDTLVLNKDDPQVRSFTEHTTQPLLCYGQSGDLSLVDCTFNTHGTTLQWHYQGEHYNNQLALWGRYQSENVLAAIGVLLQLGFTAPRIHAVLNQLTPVKGRLEVLQRCSKPIVIIDYAHTPDAIQKTLQDVREHMSGQLWCVFGCGGDRDRSKRPLMAKAAAQYADKLIITEDNSRTEPIEQIMHDICQGLTTPPEAMFTEREQAIIYALNHAGCDDVIVLAGKGHERYLDVQGAKKFFDERRIVNRVWSRER